MRVVINQPNYIPWRGYFDLIDDADLFLFFDDVQYTPRDWRNRNRIKTKRGLVWLTVPVFDVRRESLINEVKIDQGQDWQKSHQRQIVEAYRDAPYYKHYAQAFFDILNRRHEKLIDLSIETTLFLMKALGIQTPTRRASEIGASGQKAERLLNLLQAVGGDAYLSGPAAKDYIDEKNFHEAHINLAWKNYDYLPYPQLWGDFEAQVSVLDLLFNCGPGAREYLKSRKTPDPVR